MLFELNHSDYDEYSPYLFEADRTKDQWIEDVASALNEATSNLIGSYNEWIGADGIVKEAVPVLVRMGYKLRLPGCTYSFSGSSILKDKSDIRRDCLITDDLMEQVFKYNEEFEKKLHQRLRN